MAKLGGLAGQHSANHGGLFFGDQVCSGAVGCVISGTFSLQPLVAQGCRPIGPIFEVAQAQRNVLLELRQGDALQNPLAALQGLIGELPSSDRDLLRNALFVGLGKESFTMPNPETPQVSPFLVRNLMGMDPRLGAIAVADRLRIGQQLQFQLRDGNSSRQELHELLKIQQQQQPKPLAALVVGRGSMAKKMLMWASAVNFSLMCPLPVCFAMVRSAPWQAAPKCMATPQAGLSLCQTLS